MARLQTSSVLLLLLALLVAAPAASPVAAGSCADIDGFLTYSHHDAEVVLPARTRPAYAIPVGTRLRFSYYVTRADLVGQPVTVTSPGGLALDPTSVSSAGTLFGHPPAIEHSSNGGFEVRWPADVAPQAAAGELAAAEATGFFLEATLRPSPGPAADLGRARGGVCSAPFVLQPGMPGAYGLAVTGGDQDFVPADPASRPPEGRKWILVTASLENLAGAPVVVAADALTLVAQDGRRHPPLPQSPHAQPSLIGASLARGQWVLGLALFEAPRETTGHWQEWRPGGPADCPMPLRSPIPRQS